MSADVYLEYERLDVYRTALAFDAVASRLIPKRGNRFLREQLSRARALIPDEPYDHARALIIRIVQMLTPEQRKKFDQLCKQLSAN